MLKSFGLICGIDRLKSHGWAMLDAITSQRDVNWTMNRLLSPRYLSGEVFGEKEINLNVLLDELEVDSIRPFDIPSWGSSWVVKRLDQLLDQFEASILGISGINDPSSVKWVQDEHGHALIPLVLSRIWTNLIRALPTTKADRFSAYVDGLYLFTKHIVHIFERDPAGYIPISLFDNEGRCAVDVDTVRIGLANHLFDALLVLLGRDAVGATRLSQSNDEGGEGIAGVKTVMTHMPFGADSKDPATVAGTLLGQLLRAQHLSFPLQPAARTGFKRLIGKIIDAGSIQGFSSKLLGDLTNQMPWTFQDQEEIQLDVWRLLGTYYNLKLIFL